MYKICCILVTLLMVSSFVACDVGKTTRQDSVDNVTDSNFNNTEDFRVENNKLVRYMGEDEIVTVPNGVTVIGTNAFIGKRDYVKKVILPDTITTIEDMAFFGCYNLDKIEISSSIDTIGENAFKNTPWYEKLQSKNDIIVINNLLYDLNGKEGVIEIPKGVTYIPNDFFGNYCITKVIIPETVNKVEHEAFSKCYDLVSVIFNCEKCEIGEGIFDQCEKLEEVILPEGLENIPDLAFRECNSLRAIRLPQELKKIGDDAFSMCDNLIGLTIPSNVKSLSISNFYDCRGLESVTVPPAIKLIDMENMIISEDIIFYSLKNSEIETLLTKYGKKFCELEMNYTNIDMNANDTYQLELNSKAICDWTSSDEAVVSVDEKGMVTANKAGKAIVTASIYGENFTCEVTVE